MPYRISPYSSVKTNILSNPPFKCGWFLIQFLTTLSSTQFNLFQTKYNLKFETKNQINPHCFEHYLTTFQIKQLLNDPLVSLTPLHNDFATRKLKKASPTSNKCVIKSIPRWSPLDSSIFYKQISENLYVVNTSCSKLLSDKRIKSTNNYKPRKLLNRYITGFIQSGSEKGVFENGSYVSPHPLFDIGIHGEDQIISITDSGVDVLHNFFYDPHYNKIEINKTYSDHRKIYAYYTVVDGTDIEEGHGTHVSGIALGEALDTESSISLYNGMAPKSKLFFFDIGDSSDEESLSGEFEGDALYKLMSKNGVSICSNSWGYNTSFENQIMTVEYDKFAYENPEMLFLFAAGNEGSDSELKEAYLYYTINSPADSKNCLTIGSTSNTVLSTIEEERDWVIEIDGKNSIKIEPDTFGKDPWDSNIGNPKLKQSNLSIHFYNKQTGSDNIESFKDTIVFLENDQENFCSNADEVANKGATAIIHTFSYNIDCTINSKILKSQSIKHSKNSMKSFKNSKRNSNRSKSKSNDYDYDFGFGDFDETIAAPVFSISSSIDKNSKLASIIPVPTDYFKNDKMKLSYFSSLGPSLYGINKPDIVIPGEYVISAASGSHRNKNPLPATYDTLMMNSGTSMSTPAAAGLSALVRQFFTKGYYPTLKANSEDSKTFQSLTSSFIRAILVNSADPFDLKKSISITSSGPNIRTGFGLPNITNSLLYTPLRVVPNSQIKSAEKHIYPLKLHYNNGTELKVTMAYLDPPLSEESSTILFADLDLHVVSPSGRLYTGNGYKNNQTEMENTIERVIVPSSEIEVGEYQIIITSTNFTDDLIDSINYSIVVNGPFDYLDFQSNPSILTRSTDSTKKCQVSCLNGGICDDGTGRCKCDSNHLGFDCGIEIKKLELQEQFSFNLIANEVVYVKIPVGFYNDKDKPTISASTDKKDQIYKIFVSDSQFNSISDPDVFSIIADGSQKVTVPLSFTGSEEEIKNSVVYVAFKTSSPEKIEMNFILSVKNPNQPTSEPYFTPEPTESTSNQDGNVKHDTTIEESHFIETIFLFLVFFSTILIITSIVYIVILIVFRIRIRHQPVLTE